MAQPALSLKISRLERDLGAVLFLRTKRSVQLTPAGYVLLEEGKKLDRCMQGLRERVKLAAAYGDGELRIAFLGAVAPDFLPQIKAFRTRYPGIHLELQVMNLQDLHEALVQKSIDMAITVENNAFYISNLEIKRLHSEKFSLLLAEEHPFCCSDYTDFPKLVQEPFLLFSSVDVPQYHQQVIDLCAEWGFFPQIEAQFTSLEELLFRVAAGYGVTVLPLHVQTYISEKLCLKSIPLERLNGLLYRIVAWDKNRKNSAILLFYQILREFESP